MKIKEEISNYYKILRQKSDFPMLHRIFRYTSFDIDAYFRSFYEPYISSSSTCKSLVRKFDKDSGSLEKKLIGDVKSLHKKTYKLNYSILNFTDKWAKDIIKYYIKNKKLLIKNGYDIQSTTLFKNKVHEQVRWANFIIKSDNIADYYKNYEDYVNKTHKIMKSHIDEITSVELSLLDWAFKMKREISIIGRRTVRVYRTKLVEMNKLYKDSPSSSTIKNIINSFENLSSYNKSDYELVTDSISVDVNSFDKRLSKAFVSYRELKSKLLDSYQEFKIKVRFNFIYNASSFNESLDINTSIINRIGYLVYQISAYSGDVNLMKKYREESSKLNKWNRIEWEKYNAELNTVSEQYENAYNNIIEDYYELISLTLKMNDSIKKSAKELSTISNLDSSLVNNIIKYVFID
ncbi:MAG: hypothetical protein HRS57_02415 [Mycoplasmataceae bacterium]|nr:hypothetical protein [Mycoplasmataceae bacterium]